MGSPSPDPGPAGIQFVNLPSPSRDGPGSGGFTTAHIAFAESKQDHGHGKALRIPGPRDFEKGLLCVIGTILIGINIC